MREDVLERKIARIIIALSDALKVSEEQALDMFYSTGIYRQLADPETLLHLRSDGYILEDTLKELSERKTK